MPAGSSRDERLDPFALPLRFEAADHAADERVRLVELHRERVVLRRALHGIKMAVNLPVAAYLGVAIRIEPPDAASGGRRRRRARASRSRPCRSRFIAPPTAATSSPNGSPGAARSPCRS